MNEKFEGKLYTLSALSEMFKIHHQTLRIYEKRGLIKPTKIQGKRHLFDEKAVERLNRILTLTNEFDVNLAGVEIILDMREKIIDLQKDIDRLQEMLLQALYQIHKFEENEEKTTLVPGFFKRTIMLREEKRS